jgi:hypothetical protein
MLLEIISTTTNNLENKLVASKEVLRVKLNLIEFKLLKKNKPSENSTNDEINYLNSFIFHYSLINFYNLFNKDIYVFSNNL